MSAKKLGTQRPAKTAKPAVLLICSVSQLFVVLDSTVLNVALPTIATDLRLSDETLQWVINAFVVSFAGLLLLAGRLGDLIGHKRMLFWSLAIFGAASLTGGLAPSSEVLLFSRAVQGVGAAGMAPTALALLSLTFTEAREKARALGIWGAAGGGGGALGVLLGGVIVEYSSWRVALLLNVPICLWLMFGHLRFVPEQRSGQARNIDYVGGMLMTGVLAITVLALVSTGLSQPVVPSPVLWIVAVTLGFAFICNERLWTKAPILPLAPLLRRGVFAAGLVMLLAGGSLAGTFYFLTLLYQRVFGYTALETGLAYLPLSLAVFVGAGLAAAFTERIGGKLCLAAGSVLCFIGLVGFSAASHETQFWPGLFLWSVTFGLGVGILITSTASVATATASTGEQGLVSGVLTTGQHFGGALGLAGLVGVSVAQLGPAESSVEALASSYSAAFSVAAWLMAAAVVLSLLAPRRSGKSQP